jgi:hypothetical protein
MYKNEKKLIEELYILSMLHFLANNAKSLTLAKDIDDFMLELTKKYSSKSPVKIRRRLSNLIINSKLLSFVNSHTNNQYTLFLICKNFIKLIISSGIKIPEYIDDKCKLVFNLESEKKEGEVTKPELENATHEYLLHMLRNLGYFEIKE